MKGMGQWTVQCKTAAISLEWIFCFSITSCSITPPSLNNKTSLSDAEDEGWETERDSQRDLYTGNGNRMSAYQPAEFSPKPVFEVCRKNWHFAKSLIPPGPDQHRILGRLWRVWDSGRARVSAPERQPDLSPLRQPAQRRPRPSQQTLDSANSVWPPVLRHLWQPLPSVPAQTFGPRRACKLHRRLLHLLHLLPLGLPGLQPRVLHREPGQHRYGPLPGVQHPVLSGAPAPAPVSLTSEWSRPDLWRLCDGHWPQYRLSRRLPPPTPGLQWPLCRGDQGAHPPGTWGSVQEHIKDGGGPGHVGQSGAELLQHEGHKSSDLHHGQHGPWEPHWDPRVVTTSSSLFPRRLNSTQNSLSWKFEFDKYVWS